MSMDVLTNKIISKFNDWRFALVEPLLLKIARAKYEHLYNVADESPLISVYTPTYNRGGLLIQRAIPSVLAQTYKNFEYIIVGDHCTDNTEELISKINDRRIKFYNLPKRGYRYPPTAENHWFAGPVVPANKALKMVMGKWIARIDDDDSWTPDHLELLLRIAQRGNYEFVSAQYIKEVDGQREIISGSGAAGFYYTRSHKQVIGYNPNIGGTVTWLYRSYLKFFKYNINCWRKKWNRVNDVDISNRMFKAGVYMGFLEKPIAWYLPRPGEQAVGFEAYKKSEENKLKHFEFRE